jgi:hypothetical protein
MISITCTGITQTKINQQIITDIFNLATKNNYVARENASFGT